MYGGTDYYSRGWEREVDQPAPANATMGIHWMAPIYSGGGYCTEAQDVVLGLADAGVPVSIEQVQPLHCRFLFLYRAEM